MTKMCQAGLQKACIYSLFLIVLISAIAQVPKSFNLNSETDAWLSGWSYRKSHMIESSLMAGTDYQVKIVVNKGIGMDSGEDVYLNNHALNWPNEIRFTDDDGVTELDHWLESSYENNATFWIEIRDDLSAADAIIYMYYGKDGEQTASHGENTFVFFDDFENGLSKWLRKGPHGTSSIENGELSLEVQGADDYQTEIYQSYYTFSTPFILEWKENFIIYPSPAGTFQSIVQFPAEGGKYYLYYYGEEYYSFYHNGVLYDYIVTAGWHSNSLSVSSDKITFDFDGKTIFSTSGTTSFSGNMSLGAGQYTLGYSTHLHFDDVRIRKYASPEPSHGGWGLEEKPPITVTTTVISTITLTETTTSIISTTISDCTVTITLTGPTLPVPELGEFGSTEPILIALAFLSVAFATTILSKKKT